MSLKELNEKLGAKKKEARALIDAATAAKRELTAEERSKIAALQNECDALGEQVTIEARQLALEASKSPYKDLSQSEKRDVDSFDLGKAIRSFIQGEAQDGIEAELLEEGSREARAARVGGSGIFLPRLYVQRRDPNGGLAERRDMTATGGTNLNQGGYAIATEKLGILDAFFNALVLRDAGAQILTNLQGNFDWPRITSGTAPSHKAENTAGDEISPTLTGASFSPKRLPGILDLSDQLLLQTGGVIETVVRRNLTEQASSLAEYYAIEGIGNSNQPTGILSTTGIGAVVGGTNGAAPDWADIVNLEAKVNIANANRGTLHYLTNYKVKGMLNTTPKVASTDSRMILEDSASAMLNGYKPLFTNNVASNRTKGSSSGVCSSIIFGQFSDLVMAFWAGINIEMVRDVTYAKEGKRALVFNIYHDSNVIRPASFSAMKDALTTAFN